MTSYVRSYGWKLGKQQELNVIKSGGFGIKKAEIYSASVNIFSNTAILLNDIGLVAVVGGNEVTNAFMVTEVYLKTANGRWLTHLLASYEASQKIIISSIDDNVIMVYKLRRTTTSFL
jgi:hypothetical protein